MQQDGALAYYTAVVMEYLNETYHYKGIEKGGPIAWLVRSPDLTN